jgi:uncharacterized membrane protein
VTGDLITVGTVAAAVASALVAGVMFAFSTSVMPALGRRPAPEGTAAMQAMNSAILNPAFGLAFGRAALLCAVLSVTAPFTVDESHALLRGLGAALYVVGTFGVTMAINVPMNVQLDAANAGSAENVAVSSLVCRGCVTATGLPLPDILAQSDEAAARQHLPRLGKSG